MASRGGGGRPPPWVNPNTLRGVTSNPLGVGGPGRSLMAKRDFRVDQARLRHEQQQAAEKAAKTALEGLTSLRQAAETEQDLVATTPQELTIRDEVPNLGSIRSSLTNWEEVPGIQQIPISEFDSSPKDLFYAADDLARVRSLANEIRQSGEISPLIVVQDSEGYYILEGAHRLGALHEMGQPSVPALVIKDLDNPIEIEKQLIRQANYTQRAGDSSSFEERRDNEGRDVATGEPWISPSQRLLDRGIGSLSAEDLPKGKFFKNLNFPEVGYEKGDLSPGQSVAIRPNLNFGRQNQTEDIVVQSVHKDSHSYDVLGTVYGAVIKDPQFLVNPRGQLQVQAHIFSKLKDTDPKKIPSIKASKPKYPLSSVQGELVRILSMEDSIEGRINRAGVIARFNPATTNLYVVKLGDNYHAIKSVKGEVSVEGNRVYIPPESTIQFYTPQELEKINSNRATIAKELGLEKALDTEVKIFAHGGFVDKPLYDRDRSYYG